MSKSKNDRRIDYVEFQVHDIAKTKAFYGGCSAGNSRTTVRTTVNSGMAA